MIRVIGLFRAAAVAAVCLFAPVSAQDTARFRWEPVPLRKADLIIGAGTHFGDTVARGGYKPGPTEEMMASTGFTAWRDAVSWPRWEGVKAGSSGLRSDFSIHTRFAHSRRFPGPNILVFNRLPRNLENIGLPSASARFGQFVAASIETFPRNAMIEIWNEWDQGSPLSPQGRSSDYVRFVRGALGPIRQAAPERRILVGAVGTEKGSQFEWTRELIDQGLLAQADGLSVHIYDHCAPSRTRRSASDMMERLDGLHRYMVRAGEGDKPVYVSEFGWPTGGKCQVSPVNAANNVAQFVLLAAARPWIGGIWIYELKNSGRDPDSMQSHFGLFDFDGKPKPAACAAREAIALVRQGQITAIASNSRLTALRVKAAGTTRSVLWTKSLADAVTIELTRPTRARPLCAAARTEPAGAYRLSSRPVVLDGDLLR